MLARGGAARCASPMPPDPVGRLDRSRGRPPGSLRFARSPRVTVLAVPVMIAIVGAVAPALGREPVGAHPSDETEVFTGGEEVVRGAAPKRPAPAYWSGRATMTGPEAGPPLAVRR